MFDKIFKKKRPVAAEDDFFKNKSAPQPENLQKSDNPSTPEQLEDDLKAFNDDLKNKGPVKISEAAVPDDNYSESLDQASQVTNKETKDDHLISEDRSVEKWSMKKPAEEEPNDNWFNEDYEEGELAVDVYQDEDNVYVKSTIAGVNPDDVDVSIHNDMLTIRGKRQQERGAKEADYFYQECFWGSFSRSIILPVEVKAEKIDAFLKDGILTVVLPKVKKGKPAKIKIKDK